MDLGLHVFGNVIAKVLLECCWWEILICFNYVSVVYSTAPFHFLVSYLHVFVV